MLSRHPSEVTRDRFTTELNMPKEYPPIPVRSAKEGGVRERFMASVAELPDEVTVIHPFNVDAFEKSNENTLYVATDGCDENCGTKDSPLATVNEALARVRGKGGAKIVLRGGSYTFNEAVKITSEHSGNEESPLIITSEKGENVSVTVSPAIPASAFLPVTDEKMLARLKPEVRGHVLVADLASLGITEYGTPGKDSAVIMVNCEEQTLCRYPNKGDELFEVKNVVGIGYDEEKKCEIGPWKIGIPDERCFEWQWNEEICLFGALCFEWYRLYSRIAEFNKETMTMKGDGMFDKYAVREGLNNTYYFINVFEELDVPGEWYIDRTEGKLYFYPPHTLTENDDIRFINRSCEIFSCVGAENVIVNGLEMGRTMGAAIGIDDCRQVLFQRCTVSGTVGTALMRRPAVDIRSGERCGIIDSVMKYFSNRAMSLYGGDRHTLTPGNNFIQNCKLIEPRCRFGIDSGGVGNVVSHNYLLNTTLFDSGHNEGIIEYNVLEGGDDETHDTGMIYVNGNQHYYSCGNHYRYNYLFDFAMGDYGIYFDDLSQGMYAYGNIVVGNGTIDDGWNWVSGGRSFNHHGGGEHCYANNISIDAGYFAFGGDPTYWVDPVRWAAQDPLIYGTALEMTGEKFLGRYDTLRNYYEASIRYHEERKDPDYKPFDGEAERRLRSPAYNHYENNLILRANRPYKLDAGIETATGLETNFITNEDPGFVDFENRDYRFKADAVAFEKMPGFNPPPFEKMGPVCGE